MLKPYIRHNPLSEETPPGLNSTTIWREKACVTLIHLFYVGAEYSCSDITLAELKSVVPHTQFVVWSYMNPTVCGFNTKTTSKCNTAMIQSICGGKNGSFVIQCSRLSLSCLVFLLLAKLQTLLAQLEMFCYFSSSQVFLLTCFSPWPHLRWQLEVGTKPSKQGSVSCLNWLRFLTNTLHDFLNRILVIFFSK